MQHGGQEKIKWYIQLSRELGRPVKAIQDMPELMMHLHPIMEAYDVLTGSRQIGFGALGPIPFRDIVQYLEWEGITDRGEQRRWLRYIRTVDNAFLSLVNKKDGGDK